MKRSVPFALDISSDDDDDDDKPSPSNGNKNLSITKRPKIETTLINPIPAKEVITEGNFMSCQTYTDNYVMSYSYHVYVFD